MANCVCPAQILTSVHWIEAVCVLITQILAWILMATSCVPALLVTMVMAKQLALVVLVSY